MKKKLIAVIFIIIIFLLGLYFTKTDYFFHKYTQKSYTYYKNITKDIIDNGLKKNYNVKDIKPIVTTIPANYKEIWSKSRFNALNDDALYPKQKTVYIEKSNSISKIEFAFCQDTKHKQNILISRNDRYINKDTLPNINSPIFYINSFSTKFIQIYVITFPKENISSNNIEEELIEDNKNISLDIQKYILEYEK